MHVAPASLSGTSFNPYIGRIFEKPKSDPMDIINVINDNDITERVDNRPWWRVDESKNVFNILLAFASVKANESPKEEKILDPGFINIYLQYPNEKLQELTDKITFGLQDPDDKATAIILWVLRNFPYKLDDENYGREELWVPPTFALNKGSGDCEDGAFIVHSLLLHAGIDFDRIRTYGGFVDAGEGAASGGHAWTAYRRHSDDEWVVLDTSFYPNILHVAERPVMRSQSRYVDSFFYFNRINWVNTVNIDRIHNPGALAYNSNAVLNSKLEVAGWLFNLYA